MTRRGCNRLLALGLGIVVLLLVAVGVVIERVTRLEPEPVWQESWQHSEWGIAGRGCAPGEVCHSERVDPELARLVADNGRLRARLRALEAREAVERVYRRNLAAAGLTQRSEHVRSTR